LAGIGSIPFFTAIPFNALQLTSAEAVKLNQFYESTGIRFHEGENAFVLNDPLNKSERISRLEKGDLILMDILLDKEKLSYLKGQIPIPKKYVLKVAEISKIQKAISGYNSIIKSAAKENGLAFVDVFTLMENIEDDMNYNKVSHRMEYKSRSVFSLDGLHPTAFGQALLANEFIRAINNTYDCAIPFVKTLNYKGISFS